MLYVILFAWLALYLGSIEAFNLVHNYDHTNWYSSFAFEALKDPTNGFVEYISLPEAQSLGLTKIIGNQVFMGVDNTSVISTSSMGRKSIWLESNDEFKHGILIGDFAHLPGGDCGSWPAFWSIRNTPGLTYGEIDIYEGFNDIDHVYTTLHTEGDCTFKPPPSMQLGGSNNENYDCNLDSDVGCSVKGPPGSYGSALNAQGGGVYAMWWTSSFIKIYFFPRNSIPKDIQHGIPNPQGWGNPMADFDSQYGNCDIDANFPPQTIYFDTTFCGANAGGNSWSKWTDCASKTGYSTCQEFVANTPSAYDEAYWLINSVKVYQ